MSSAPGYDSFSQICLILLHGLSAVYTYVPNSELIIAKAEEFESGEMAAAQVVVAVAFTQARTIKQADSLDAVYQALRGELNQLAHLDASTGRQHELQPETRAV